EVEALIRDRGHGGRQSVGKEDADRLGAVRVREVVGVVRRDEEHAVLLPLERDLRPVAGPDRRQATALDHVGQVVDGDLEWRRRLPWRDLDQRGAADTLLPRELEERHVAAATVPVPE